jgi:prepilin-type N-terminal cleavage/methylation domain-containing protein
MLQNMRKSKGFTMVEMALVLVVIGIILGAVSVGRNMQKNAEYKKIQQKFVEQWVIAYNQYYGQTNTAVGDDVTAPTLIVNGRNVDAAAYDKFLEEGGDLSMEELCQVGTVDPTAAPDPDASLLQLFADQGIDLPPGRAKGKEDRYGYTDSEGNPAQIKICFQWMPPGTAAGSGNLMLLKGLEPDLAIALDSAIDSRPDGTDGRFRHYSEDGKTAVAWPAVTVTDGKVGKVTAAFKMAR